MISRTFSAPLLLAATVGVPYVASNAPEWTQQFSGAVSPSAAAPPAQVQSTPAAVGAPAVDAAAPAAMPATPTSSPPQVAPFPQAPGANLLPAETPLEGVQTYSIAEVLRMDISKEWVYQRWPRKSTALADLDLFGVRVPLVSGTQLHDIAGSLTYYFGPDGRVKRITFIGRTGDTTQLAAIAHQRFGMQARTTAIAGEQLLQHRNGDHVLSELRTRPAPVLWANTPHDSFAVELVIQDPAFARPLSGPVMNVTTPPPTAGALAPATPTNAAASPATPSQPAPPVAEPAESLGWKALFPRSRLPKAQVNNLDQANLYQ